MHEDVYDLLAVALDRLPGGFPATPSHAERPLLRRLFTPLQARIGATLGHEPRSAAAIGERADLPTGDVAAALAQMEAEGLVASDPRDEAEAHFPHERRYRLESFVPGIFEHRAAAMDEDLARLFEAYMADGGAAAIMGSSPAIARVAPSAAARSEWILPRDDVQRIIEQTPTIVLNDCVCRLEREALGERCRFPLRVCLNLSDGPPSDGQDVISTEEALAVLNAAEEAGLVHTVSNVAGRWDWICNCCACCCEFLRSYTEWDVDAAVVRDYRATIDADLCTACATCMDRCQVGVADVVDGLATVDRARCLGCGLCVSTCPSDAARLERLPAAELVEPPADPEAWAEERLRTREKERDGTASSTPPRSEDA